MSKPILVLVGMTFTMLLTGCGVEGGIDLSPVGSGLSLIGLALVLSAIIKTLGRSWLPKSLLRKEESDEKL